ncbi:MAG: mechanosensitive ion channel domain-containing protein [Magnetospiraceae bacterium]
MTFKSLSCVLLGIFLLLVFLGTPAVAQDAPADQAKADTGEVDALIQTLEDPAQREKLIEALRAASAEGTTEAPPETVFTTTAGELITAVAEQTSNVTESGAVLLESVKEVPQLVDGAVQSMEKPEVRARVSQTALRLVIIFGAGFTAAFLAGQWTKRFRVAGKVSADLPTGQRAVHLFGQALLQVVGIGVFVLVSYAAMTLVDPRSEVRLVAVAIINATIFSRFAGVFITFLFAPRSPNLRLLEISDQTAISAHRWIVTITAMGFYGFFGLQAAVLSGLGEPGYQALLRLLGLVVLIALLFLILRHRRSVARVIAGKPGDSRPLYPLSPMSPLRRALSRIWHLLAILYCLATYLILVIQLESGGAFILKATGLTLFVAFVAWILLRLLSYYFLRRPAIRQDVLDRLPGLDQRVQRYVTLLRIALRTAVYLTAILFIADAWDMGVLEWLVAGPGSGLLGALSNVAVIVVIAILVWELARGGIERYLAENDSTGTAQVRSPRIRTLLTVARNAVLVLVTLISTLMILSEMGIDIAPLLAGAGVLGLAIGFGSQRLVQDVINGAFILFQDLMSVGDVVKVGDKAGLVEALSIRTVRLRDLTGTVHTIPFNSIDTISNLTRDFSFHVFDIGIAYREDVDAVVALIKEVGEELRQDPKIGPLILDAVEVFGLDAFGDSAIVIKGRIKTQPIKQWDVGRAFNRLIKIRFDEQNIEIPFPHQTLYFGVDKEGKAPPALVQLMALEKAETEATVTAKTEAAGQAPQAPDQGPATTT